jgi:hypothetical protein
MAALAVGTAVGSMGRRAAGIAVDLGRIRTICMAGVMAGVVAKV